MRRHWVYSPHSGGQKIPPFIQEKIQKRIQSFAEKHYAGEYNRIDVRFRGPFCYIDAYVEPTCQRSLMKSFSARRVKSISPG